MKIVERVADWRATRRRLTGSLGFVATMGALHAGHLSLIDRSLAENDATLVSIFVNPTQFDNADDFASYPDRTAEDRARLEARGVPYLWLPRRDELYADDYRYRVSEHAFSRVLCGAHRPGHFDGVLTVVMKLLNVAQADRAYFGEKDFQQLQLVKGMVDAFFIPSAVIGCPTVREDDGLALSSRNLKLAPHDRARAAAFPRALGTAATAADARASLEAQGFAVDYVEDRDGRRFGAVRIGDVRLIDNVVLG
jgi:pantoate--beta-alanine ligase